MGGAWGDDMMAALAADGEKLRHLTGSDHGPFGVDDYFDEILELEQMEEGLAQVATYEDWFPDLAA